MMYLVFHRESNNFKDILSDTVLKKAIRLKMSCYQYLILDLVDDKATSYAMIKYGDDAISMSHIIPDRSPIAGKDYVPERKERNKKLKIQTT